MPKFYVKTTGINYQQFQNVTDNVPTRNPDTRKEKKQSILPQ